MENKEFKGSERINLNKLQRIKFEQLQEDTDRLAVGPQKTQPGKQQYSTDLASSRNANFFNESFVSSQIVPVQTSTLANDLMVTQTSQQAHAITTANHSERATQSREIRINVPSPEPVD